MGKRDWSHIRYTGLEGEEEVADVLKSLGCQVENVNLTYDFLVTTPSGRQLKVEVKKANPYPSPKGIRRQATIRYKDADLIIILAAGLSPVYFIIPMDVINGRHHFGLYCNDPANHKGQWAKYREAWHYLE